MPTLRHTPHRRRRRLAVVLVAIAAAIATAACSLLPPGLVMPEHETALVTFERHGGDCPEGECRFTAEIHRDGRVVRSDGQGQVVDAPSLARLVEQVDSADWAAILAVPFEDACPTAYDGQEEVYTFRPGRDPVVVASCSVVVQDDREPFRTVQEILFGPGG